MFFSPKADGFYRDALAEGFARPGARRTADDFEVACVVPDRSPATTSRPAPTSCGPTLALYIGGMGARDRNFHKDVFARLGYEAECEKIQEAYLAGRKDEAAGCGAHARWSRTSTWSGRKEKIRDDLEGWRESCVTTLLVSGPSPLLQQIAELVPRDERSVDPSLAGGMGVRSFVSLLSR